MGRGLGDLHGHSMGQNPKWQGSQSVTMGTENGEEMIYKSQLHA